MNQVSFILRSKVQSMGANDEYQYIIEVVSNTGNKYQSYDVWHGYAQNAKDAKRQILLNIAQTQSIDYVLDDKIIKDDSGIPYFILLEPNNHVHPIFKNIINSF